MSTNGHMKNTQDGQKQDQYFLSNNDAGNEMLEMSNLSKKI